MNGAGIVTLLTDFGTDDAYVGAMKGSILSVNRRIQIVDISHAVAVQGIIEAAWLLRSAYRYFPPGTVHVVVVDPTVGSSRRAIAVRALNQYFVAPDNGVLFWALREADVEAVELKNHEYFRSAVSTTFHGRDVFAPVGAHLATGVPFGALGPIVAHPIRLAIPLPQVTANAIHGSVAHIDRFGNVITNVEAPLLDTWSRSRERLAVSIAGREITAVVSTYSDVRPGDLLVLFESTGCLEIAVRDGSAAGRLRVARGADVTITAL